MIIALSTYYEFHMVYIIYTSIPNTKKKKYISRLNEIKLKF